jgi:Family of unknown function (DUF5681)
MAIRGKPFEPGNKLGRGRPPGSRNKTTLLAQQLLDTHAESLIKKCIVMAMQGDTKAMQLCIDRIVPTRRELPVRIGTLPTRTAAELDVASETLTQKVTAGELTPTQGQAFAAMLDQRRQVIETQNLDQRLRAVEAQQ